MKKRDWNNIGRIAAASFAALLAVVALGLLLGAGDNLADSIVQPAAADCGQQPALPVAPVVISIRNVQDAPADFMRSVVSDTTDVMLQTNRPISITIDGLDYCSDCDEGLANADANYWMGQADALAAVVELQANQAIVTAEIQAELDLELSQLQAQFQGQMTCCPTCCCDSAPNLPESTIPEAITITHTGEVTVNINLDVSGGITAALDCANCGLPSTEPCLDCAGFSISGTVEAGPGVMVPVTITVPSMGTVEIRAFNARGEGLSSRGEIPDAVPGEYHWYFETPERLADRYWVVVVATLLTEDGKVCTATHAILEPIAIPDPQSALVPW